MPALEPISHEVSSLRLELRTKNNRLWHLIFDRYGSVRRFCLQHGISEQATGRLLNLKSSPWKKNGELTKTAAEIVEATGKNVIWLFDPDLYDQRFFPSTPGPLVAEVDPTQILSLSSAADVPALNAAPDEILETVEAEEIDVIDRVLSTLTPREEGIIRLRWGLGPNYGERQTYDMLAGRFGVTRERVRKIEGKALHKLRHPLRGKVLLRYLRGDSPQGGYPPPGGECAEKDRAASFRYWLRAHGVDVPRMRESYEVANNQRITARLGHR
jgi:RNA polymerase sigma factor (sigma-70 family)